MPVYTPSALIAAHNKSASSTSHGLAGLTRRQLTRLSEFRDGLAGFTKQEERKKKKQAIRAQAQRDELKSRFSSDLFDKLTDNPHMYGLPRKYKVLLAGHETVDVHGKVADHEFYVDEGHTILFACFGHSGHGLWIDNTWVYPEQVQLSADRQVYTFSAELDQEDGGGRLAGYINFMTDPTPTGVLIYDKDVYALQLQPYLSSYTFSVSANAGATLSSGKGDFVWDPDSTAWKNASWESNAGIFGFDVVTIIDPIIGDFGLVEVGFTDNRSSPLLPPPAFDLSLDSHNRNNFIAVVQEQSDRTHLFSVEVSETYVIPSPPPARQGASVKSVFPQSVTMRFDYMAQSFTGAYADSNNNVYAIRGTESSSRSTSTSSASLPDHSGDAQVRRTPGPFSRTKACRVALVSKRSDLTITGLLNLSPMQFDKEADEWYDAVSRVAMNDFHDGILTFMDDDLFHTFIGGDKPRLTAEVKSILYDQSDTSAFYKSLQVPLLTALLSTSDKDSAALLNGNRAMKVLRDIPADNEVYNRHSSAFYALRWKEMYPSIQQYLDDQSTVDYSGTISKNAGIMKDILASRLSGVPDPTGSLARHLKEAQDDIDGLAQWAIKKKLYWAFSLLYYAETYYLPELQGKMAKGSLSQQVAMEIKAMGAVFGILESSAVNPDGPNFETAFNDMIRSFNLSIILPQFVDAGGNMSEFSDLIHDIVENFISTHAGSNDANMQKSVANARDLLGDDIAIITFLEMLQQASLTAATLYRWRQTIENIYIIAESSSWYKALKNGAGMLDLFLQTSSVGLTIYSLVADGWSSMTTSARIQIVFDGVDLLAATTIKIAEGLIHLGNYWTDVTPWMSRIRLFFGSEKILDSIPLTSNNIQRGFSSLFTRTAKDSMSFMPTEYSTILQIFGRNITTFIAEVVGTVLAVVNIVLSAISLASATDPLQIAADIISIVSASFVILSVAAGWIAGSLATSEAVAIVGALELVASWLGPLGLVLAIAGLIIAVILMFRPQDPPDPIKQFAENQANKAGLYMPQRTAVDYFDVVPPDEKGGNSLTGLSLLSRGKYLSVHPGTGEPVSFGVGLNGDVTFAPDTCLNVETDGEGYSTIWTMSPDADGRAGQACLAITDDGQVVALPSPSKVYKDSSGDWLPVDPEVYEKQLSQQQWICECLKKGDTVTPEDDRYYLLNGTFTIKSRSSGKYLALDSAGVKVVQSTAAQDWELKMQPVRPGKLSYVWNPWVIGTTSRDEISQPRLDTLGSQPLTWTISPSLVEGLELKTSGSLAGTLSIAAGRTAVRSPSREHTVTASIKIGGRTYSQVAKVTVQVQENTLT